MAKELSMVESNEKGVSTTNTLRTSGTQSMNFVKESGMSDIQDMDKTPVIPCI